ncbi:MAG: hypothetical protein A3J29_05225 [Acidobacteria bacterium RIFCSPLOWO2_12_FULL_67_14b]|nr:MAG: hypothetical protein A3J29_05225 [Acidobacteria bacterium RIFCSPLOWO2_12_FULL_67_14b]
MAVAVALVVSATFAVAQPAPKKDEKKRSKQEQQEIEQVVKLVDGVMAGQPAPTDITMSIEPFFMKSQETRTFVPFVLNVTNAPKTDAAMYVRVVDPAAEPDPKAKRIEYPWDDIHFVPAAQLAGDKVILNRVFMAVAGTYDVYIAFKERLPEKAPKNTVPKMGVLKTQVTVPDFYNAELNTSTILVADTVNMLTAPIGPEQARERPFVFGAQELLPAIDMEFKKAEELSIFFQVYNSGLDQTGKPNLVLEYEFHKTEAGAEKFFNKTNPQVANSTNLPPQFDPAKFPVPGGITVPLASFGDGQYRLAIKITDKAAGKTLNRDVKFTVKG